MLTTGRFIACNRSLCVISRWKGSTPRYPPIQIREEDLEEKFVKGGGSGGQKVNKTSSKVQLRHIPSGIFVQTQDQRDLPSNRKIARRLLKEKLDMAQNGDDSKIGRRVARIRRRKSKAAQRAKAKYRGTLGIDSDDSDAETQVPPRAVPGGQPLTTAYSSSK